MSFIDIPFSIFSHFSLSVDMQTLSFSSAMSSVILTNFKIGANVPSLSLSSSIPLPFLSFPYFPRPLASARKSFHLVRSSSERTACLFINFIIVFSFRYFENTIFPLLIWIKHVFAASVDETFVNSNFSVSHNLATIIDLIEMCLYENEQKREKNKSIRMLAVCVVVI